MSIHHLCQEILTLSAHVRCGHPHVHYTTVFVQMHHGLWGHGLPGITPAARGVVHHIPLCLEVHYCSDAQLVLQLDCHVFYLSRAAAQPNTRQYPERNKEGSINHLFLYLMYFYTRYYTVQAHAIEGIADFQVNIIS